MPRMAMSPGSGSMLPSLRSSSCAVVCACPPAAAASWCHACGTSACMSAPALRATLPASPAEALPRWLPVLPRRDGTAACTGGVPGWAPLLGVSGRRARPGAAVCSPCLAAAHASRSVMAMPWLPLPEAGRGGGSGGGALPAAAVPFAGAARAGTLRACRCAADAASTSRGWSCSLKCACPRGGACCFSV